MTEKQRADLVRSMWADLRKTVHGYQDGKNGPNWTNAARKRDLLLRDLEPPVVQLVEPKQGFESLHRSLWQAFSEGRRRGLTDLGTYNPESQLPSGAPSDHAVYPAYAFDLGIDPDTGWANLKARAYAIWTAGRPEVEYVILGNRIWTSRTKFWGSYYNGGHMNHVHVSGHR